MDSSSDDQTVRNVNSFADDSESDRPLVVSTITPMSRVITTEPALLLLFLSYSLSGTILANQIIYQACNVRFGFNETECSLLGTANATNRSQEIELVVQPYAANIVMARTMVESIVPAFMTLFIGPWSDKYGRRPVLISSCSGYFLVYFLITIISFISTMIPVDPWVYVLAFVPAMFTGGSSALITGVLSYVTDVTSPKDRALRMSFQEAALFIGILLGSLSSSYIYRWTSATTLFAISAVFALIAVLYIVFSVVESVHSPNISIGKLKQFGALFDVTLVSDMFDTCFKRRPNLDRAIIFLIMSALVASIFAMEGSATVFYLFVREHFEWTIKQASFYDSTGIVLQTCGSIFGMYVLNRWCGMSESMLAILASTSYIVDYGIKAIATQPWQLYAGSVITLLKAIASPMCRTILANTVPASEVGKLYALTTALECLSPLGSAPLYSLVYSSTIAFYPGAFNLISSAVYFLVVVLLILVRMFQKRYPSIPYSAIQQS